MTTTFVTQGGLGQGFRSWREKGKLSSVLFLGDNDFWFFDK